MTELSQVRTAALQHEIARDPALARDVLLDALLGIVLAEGHVAGHAVQLSRAGTLQSANVFDINAIEIPSPFDGIADLQAAMPDDAEQRFAWLSGLGEDEKARLLAFATAALLDATAGKFADRARLRSADRIACAVKLDMRGHFEGGVEFYARLTRRAMLAALSEAISPQAAENCAKLAKAALVTTCAERIPGRGWLPPALRTPEPEFSGADDRDDELVNGQEAMAYAAE